MPQILDLRKKDDSEEESKVTAGRISGQIRPEDQLVDKILVVITSLSLIFIGSIFVWQKNFITATFFILLGIVMLTVGFKSKKTVEWELSGFGLTLDSSSYHYQELKSFWIEYQPPYLKELSFKGKKWYHSYIKIPLNKENPLDIRAHLLQFLPEERHEDTLVEMISRKFGI